MRYRDACLGCSLMVVEQAVADLRVSPLLDSHAHDGRFGLPGHDLTLQRRARLSAALFGGWQARAADGPLSLQGRRCTPARGAPSLRRGHGLKARHRRERGAVIVRGLACPCSSCRPWGTPRPSQSASLTSLWSPSSLRSRGFGWTSDRRQFRRAGDGIDEPTGTVRFCRSCRFRRCID